MCVYCDALITNSGKGQHTLPNGTAVDLLCQLLRRGHSLDVDHGIAMAANEMCVRMGIEVKAFHAIDRSQRSDPPLLLERRQIAIHRSKGEIRILRLEAGINPVGRGMFFCQDLVQTLLEEIGGVGAFGQILFPAQQQLI